MMFIVTAHLVRQAMRFKQIVMVGYVLHVHFYGRMCRTCIVMAGCVARALLWQDTFRTCIVMAG